MGLKENFGEFLTDRRGAFIATLNFGKPARDIVQEEATIAGSNVISGKVTIRYEDNTIFTMRGSEFLNANHLREDHPTLPRKKDLFDSKQDDHMGNSML